MAGVGPPADGGAAALRRRGFQRPRGGRRRRRRGYLYGDRNRWTKLATLVSHLGLILFLVAGR